MREDLVLLQASKVLSSYEYETQLVVAQCAGSSQESHCHLKPHQQKHCNQEWSKRQAKKQFDHP